MQRRTSHLGGCTSAEAYLHANTEKREQQVRTVYMLESKKDFLNAEHILRAPDARSDKLKEPNGQKGFTRLEYLRLRKRLEGLTILKRMKVGKGLKRRRKLKR